MSIPAYTVAEIARVLDIRLPDLADPATPITGIATLDDAGPGDVALLNAPKYIPSAKSTRAAAIVISAELASKDFICPAVRLVVAKPDFAFLKLLTLFDPGLGAPDNILRGNIDPRAAVHPTASIDPAAVIGPGASVGRCSSIAAGVVLHPGVAIGDGCTIGPDSVLFPNVVIRDRCIIGSHVVIHSGTVIGADGFGYRFDGKQHIKIPQIGNVIIEDDVEIGANSCIDRAKTGSTRIGRGTKIDNLVQIGHNCQIGPLNIIVSCVGIGGSTKTGKGVVIGGGCAIRDHIHLGDRVQVAAFSGVVNDVPAGTTIGGYHASDMKSAAREIVAAHKVPELLKRVSKLERLAGHE